MILRHNGANVDFKNLYNRRFMNEWLSNGVSTDGEKYQSGTMKTYLGSVQHFLRFLCVTEQKNYDLEQIAKFNPILSAWKRDLWKGIQERKHSKNLEDLHKFPDSFKINNLDDSEYRSESINTLKRYCSEINPTITRSGFCTVRDYILTYALMDNGSRPGAMVNMTIEEFEKADEQDDGFVVSVKKHKTSYKGPAHIGFNKELYNEASSYIRVIRSRLPGTSIEKCSPVFVSWSGIKMGSSLITSQFNSYWSKALGLPLDSRNINPNLMRKYITTLVHKKHQELAKDTAGHLNHTFNVAVENYDIIDKQKKAASISKQLHNIQRQSDPDELSKEKLCELFKTEISSRRIDKATVIEKLHFLGKSGLNEKTIKKVLDTVRYIIKCKQNNDKTDQQPCSSSISINQYDQKCQQPSSTSNDDSTSFGFLGIISTRFTSSPYNCEKTSQKGIYVKRN